MAWKRRAADLSTRVDTEVGDPIGKGTNADENPMYLGSDFVPIELEQVDYWDDEVGVDSAHLCGVALRDDRPVAISLRYPREQSGPLREAASRFGLDGSSLDAVLQAALAAPNQTITIAT